MSQPWYAELEASRFPLKELGAFLQKGPSYYEIQEQQQNALTNGAGAASVIPRLLQVFSLINEDESPKLGTSEGSPGLLTIYLAKGFETKTSSCLSHFLGISPTQAEDENQYNETHANEPPLIQVAARIFKEASGGCVLMDRKRVGVRGLRVSICHESMSDDFGGEFHFSPSYLSLNGLDPTTRLFSRELEAQQTKELARIMTEEALRCSVLQDNYMMDSELEKELTGQLICHFSQGIRGQREGFLIPHVSRPMGLFVTGQPGVGKSTFVGTFRRSLQHVLQKYVDPQMQVRLVKIPLNSMTPESLRMILNIRGISDWSIERMLEQSLAKGHSVILHGEEMPEDFTLQMRLVECIQEMLVKLYARYPEYKCNVVFVFTSNYSPCDHLTETLARTVRVQRPQPEAQKRWLLTKLKQVLSQSVENVQVTVSDKSLPSFQKGDVRPLNAWWQSIGHALVKALPAALTKSRDALTDVCAVLDPSSQPNEIKVQWTNSATNEALSEWTTLRSQDGYFWSPRYEDDRDGSGELAKIRTIVDMAIRGFLTPAVVVDVKNSGLNLIELIQRHPDIVSGERKLVIVDELTLRSPEDELQVMGSTSEIRGGLLREIDDATNPNIIRERSSKRARVDGEAHENVTDVVLVRARVNTIGAMLLRELIEDGDKSRTHRLGVSKTGLIFSLTWIDPAEPLAPQLVSRAHHVIE